MNQIVAQFLQVTHAMWRRRWVGVAVAWGVAMAMGAVVMLVPERYEATAQIYVDTQTVLKPLMQGLAYQPDVDQQVVMLARTLISRPNVEQLVDSKVIGLNPSDSHEREGKIDALMKGIKVTPSGKNLYLISYRDKDRARSQRLVQGLVELFVDSGTGQKRRDSEEARRFIDDQIQTYEAKLADAENRLKEFKLRNFGLTGTSNQDYFARISTLSDEISRLRVELAAAERSRDALKRELLNEDPQLPFDPARAGVGAGTLSDTDGRLDAQRRQLDELMRRYTDEHPDVVSTQRSIAALERQKQQELAASGGARGRGNAATSPVYQRIRIALAEAEANVASLRTQLSEQQARLEQARATAGKVPQAEAELAQLNRDYDVIRRNYEQLVTRRESAALGERMDQSSQVADFRLVEPPRASERAVFPDRKTLAALGLLLSMAAGAAVTFALTKLFPVFNSASELREVSGRPVLGSVSMIVLPTAKLQERRDRLAFAGAGVLLIALHVVWVGWITWHARG